MPTTGTNYFHSVLEMRFSSRERMKTRKSSEMLFQMAKLKALFGTRNLLQTTPSPYRGFHVCQSHSCNMEIWAITWVVIQYIFLL